MPQMNAQVFFSRCSVFRNRHRAGAFIGLSVIFKNRNVFNHRLIAAAFNQAVSLTIEHSIHFNGSCAANFPRIDGNLAAPANHHRRRFLLSSSISIGGNSKPGNVSPSRVPLSVHAAKVETGSIDAFDLNATGRLR